jgi:hypothetical protein
VTRQNVVKDVVNILSTTVMPTVPAGTPNGTPNGTQAGTQAGAQARVQPPAHVVTIRRKLITILAFALAAVGLFVLYLRVSQTYPENSDEANILLMAWDMLHGHVMLHGWWLSDVSFYTTELPEYVLLESFLGLHPGTAHVGAAVTYTLVVLFAAVLARGKAAQVPAGEGTIRMLLTTGILIAPQLGVGVFIDLLSVGHIGTAVPLMLTWLVIDRQVGANATRRSPGWFAPVATGVLLAWAMVADQLVVVAGMIPLALVCLIRVADTAIAVSEYAGRSAWWRAMLRIRGYELALVVAAGAGFAVGKMAYGLIHYFGGFRVHSVSYQLVSPAQWPGQAWVTVQGWLAMFGAYPSGHGTQIAFAIVHMIGVALVAWAMWRVAGRFFLGAGLIDQVLLVSIVLNVAMYVPSTLGSTTDLNAREYAVALPFGAVLAGRTFGAPLCSTMHRRAVWAWGELRGRWVRWTVPALAAVLAAYLASLGFNAAQPAAAPANEQLATWLAAHHLTYGIGGYWQSSIVTVDSDGRVTIRAVYPGSLRRDWWESKHSWYDPAVHAATFLVTDSAPGFYHYWEPNPVALAGFGLPAATYQVGSYTVYVWNRNLLG